MTTVSLKRNIIASYFSQIYVALIGIVVLPLYLKNMGAESYGLIGFFTMLQAWFLVLDIGLTPTLARETARYNANALTPLAFRQLFRSLSVIFLTTAVLGSFLLLFFSAQIVENWLNLSTLSVEDALLAVQIMAIIVAMRWMCGMYRGVVSGSERLVWLSIYNIVIATLRFVIVLPVMHVYGYTPRVFFTYQLIIACVELAVLYVKATKLLPSTTSLPAEIGWSMKPVRAVIRFALSIALTASIWVFVTQMDKLLLSGILPLDEYGYFTLAVLAASVIMVISGPISSAILPRMANLHAGNNRAGLIELYRKSSRLVCILCGTAAITLFYCAQPILYFWTGDSVLAEKISPILQLYAMGNGLLAISAFPYYLQYARGNLNLHIIGNLILLLLLVPSVIYFATRYGAIGAGYIWLSLNALYFFIWVPLVHIKLEPGLHQQWIFKDVLIILLPALILSGATYPFVAKYFDQLTRLASGTFSMVIGLIIFTLIILASSDGRKYALSWTRN